MSIKITLKACRPANGAEPRVDLLVGVTHGKKSNLNAFENSSLNQCHQETNQCQTPIVRRVVLARQGHNVQQQEQ